MKVFSVVGTSLTGKTTTIENIIQELRKRRYSIGSVKDIHYEKFAIDTEGTNTDRHYKAGSQLVTARGIYETDILFKNRLSIKDILRFYDHDFVVLEGVEDFVAPKIICASTTDEIDDKLDATAIAISGKIANKINEYRGIPAVNALEEPVLLVDLIEKQVCPVLPNMAEDCCNECGYSCKKLLERIIRGKSKRDECLLERESQIRLTIDGKKIDIVPFVQAVLKNTVKGVVKELEGYKQHAEIKIEIKKEE